MEGYSIYLPWSEMLVTLDVSPWIIVYPRGLSLRLDALTKVPVPEIYASYVQSQWHASQKSKVVRGPSRRKILNLMK